MKRSIFLGLLFIAVALFNYSMAQEVELEKTYKLDGKARRGVLKNVVTLENGNYELYYVTKAKTTKCNSRSTLLTVNSIL